MFSLKKKKNPEQYSRKRSAQLMSGPSEIHPSPTESAEKFCSPFFFLEEQVVFDGGSECSGDMSSYAIAILPTRSPCTTDGSD